jgi:NAD(P)-dependent dehydrogenase (short-subunit alcohol dehydrogenase family)
MFGNVMNAFSLKGKTALVTGGYRGVGFGISLALAQAGADVVIMSRSEEGSLKAIGDLKQYGGRYGFLCGDISSREDCERVVCSVRKEYGRLDVLVNNAGICRHTETFGMDFADWYDVINVNLNGTFLMSYYAGQAMKEHGGGSIINITSMSAEIVNIPQWQCSYNASKAAVNQLTRSLALEWAPYNIRVNAIAPGYINTDMIPPDEGKSKGWARLWVEMTPQKRMGEGIEVGAMAVYLASDASAYTTGSVLLMDGGYSLP